MARNDETERLIAEAWDERSRLATERGQILFPGPMCRFTGWSIQDGTLLLAFGRTDYRELVGTNILHPEIAARFGDDYLSNGTGVCTVVETSDGVLIAHRRSGRVFEYPGLIDVCGGALEPIEDGDGLIVDPFESIAREIEEELAIPRAAIAEITCLGVARDGRTLKPEVLMRTRLSIPAERVPALDDVEHLTRFMVPNEPASLAEWLAMHWDEITPASLACLVAHAACAFATGVAALW